MAATLAMSAEPVVTLGTTGSGASAAAYSGVTCCTSKKK
jgi:hypothetical protein